MTVTGIITAIIIGAIIGALGRLVVPGRQPIPIWLTKWFERTSAWLGRTKSSFRSKTRVRPELANCLRYGIALSALRLL